MFCNCILIFEFEYNRIARVIFIDSQFNRELRMSDVPNDGNNASEVSTTRENNPLLKHLSPRQFNASVKFYEADQQLKPEDRTVIADDLQSVLYKSAIIGYGSAVFNFFIPTIFERLKSKERLPPFFKRPKIEWPFFSLVLGLSALIFTNDQVANYEFNQKINALLQDYQENSSKQRQANVWKAMEYHQASLFFLYYRKTAEDPSFIISDPRKFTEKQMHQVHYNPPNNNAGPSSRPGISNSDYTSSLGSHWDHIRLANGFGPLKSAPKVTDVTSDSPSTFEPNNEEGNSVSSENKYKSMWDRIRDSSSK